LECSPQVYMIIGSHLWKWAVASIGKADAQKDEGMPEKGEDRKKDRRVYRIGKARVKLNKSLTEYYYREGQGRCSKQEQ